MHASRFVVDEGRSRVAKPDTIVRDEMRAHVARHAVRPQMLLARGTHIVIVAEDLHPLVLREHTDNLGVHPWDGPQLPRPVRLVVRPGDPGGLVERPLGGEGVARRHAGGLVGWMAGS